MPKSKIDWTDYTWNPVSGCTKVSEGCKFCYAETFSKRTLKPFDQPGRKFTDIVFHENMFGKLDTFPNGSKIFVGSVTDIFHPDVPDSFLERLWNQFLRYSGLPLVKRIEKKKFIFQILTKRPERMMEFTNKYKPLPNVWLGVSAENQQRLDERLPLLMKTRAAIRFLSLEPLLGKIDLQSLVEELILKEIETGDTFNPLSSVRPDWVIIGGESGPKARECNLLWINELVKQCQTMNIPVFVKQLGAKLIYSDYDDFTKTGININLSERKLGPKGNNFEYFPEYLKIREFPHGKE